MTTYVAFLRAINLGARRQFPKDAIVAATRAAGFDDVATHINTGNVRLSTTMRSRARIEAALEEAYLADRGFEVPAIAFTAAELVQVLADAEEFGRGAERHYVCLLKDDPGPDALAVLERHAAADDRVAISGRAAHLVLGTDYHRTRLTNANLERGLGMLSTHRNLAVVRAVVERWCR